MLFPEEMPVGVDAHEYHKVYEQSRQLYLKLVEGVTEHQYTHGRKDVDLLTVFTVEKMMELFQQKQPSNIVDFIQDILLVTWCQGYRYRQAEISRTN